MSTLPQEPPVPIATNVRGQTGSQDVQEDLGEIDTGGTHRHTGDEREEEEEPLELVDDIVTGQGAVIGVDLVELEEERPEQHHQEGEQPPQVEWDLVAAHL